MSTQRAEPVAAVPASDLEARAQRSRRFVLAMRLLAGLSALVSLAALWSVEGRKLAHDLQLAAPTSARPGDRIALRALLFRDVDAPEGASLAVADSSVRLRDASGRELAKVALTATELETLDGTLQLPALAGEFILEARARFEETDLICLRRLSVSVDAAGVTPHGREAGPLQHLSLGQVRSVAARAPASEAILARAPDGELRRSGAPLPFLPRVVGGACIPDEPCRLLVWVGQPAAALTARIDAGAELVGPTLPVGETSGIAELQVVVRGPDAQLTLEARRAGALVGERAVRLPVGLGEVGLPTRASMVEQSAIRVSYLPPPGRAFVTFDSFAGAHWSGVSVLPSDPNPRKNSYTVPPAFSGLGLFRLQARSDRLSADGSGARVFYVRAPGETDAQALSQLALAAARTPALAEEPTAGWTQQLPDFSAGDPQQSAAFLLAGLEQLRMPVPLPVSGRPTQLKRLEHTRAFFRFGVSGALVLSAIAMALSVARRGLAAADEAQSILDAARAEADDALALPLPGEVFGARMRVLLLALAVAAAFLAAALLIAAKPLWF